MFGPSALNPIPALISSVHGNGLVVQDTRRQCLHSGSCANACPQGAIQVDPKTARPRGCHERRIGRPPLRKRLARGDMMSFG